MIEKNKKNPTEHASDLFTVEASKHSERKTQLATITDPTKPRLRISTRSLVCASTDRLETWKPAEPVTLRRCLDTELGDTQWFIDYICRELACAVCFYGLVAAVTLPCGSLGEDYWRALCLFVCFFGRNLVASDSSCPQSGALRISGGDLRSGVLGSISVSSEVAAICNYGGVQTLQWRFVLEPVASAGRGANCCVGLTGMDPKDHWKEFAHVTLMCL